MPIIEKNNTFYMSENARIRHDILESDAAPYHEHSHDFVEFVYMLSGRCTHTVDGVAYPMKRGDLLIVNYNQRHNRSGGEAAEYINILLKPEFISQSLVDQDNAFALLNLSEFADFEKTLDETKSKVSFSGKERDTVENIILNLEHELKNAEPGYALSAHSWFNLLLVKIFRKMSLLLAENFNGVSDELLVYIKEHCGERLTLSDIANRCHYNPSYFSRNFRQFTGISFTDYLKKVRIDRAVHLLCTTSMKVADVCQDVGYTDKTKFFKHFRELVGMTPLQLRKSKK